MRSFSSVTRIIAVAVAGVFMPVVALSSPAEAACTTKWKTYAPSISNSTELTASSSCNGLWAWRADVKTDDVQGRFYKEGAWQTSSYGWKTITTASQSGGKIIGDTTTGRKLKGQSKKHTQTVQSQY